jgi:hypothetical protein
MPPKSPGRRTWSWPGTSSTSTLRRPCFDAMKEVWARQQHSGRILRSETISSRVRLIERMGAFTGFYPGEWTPAEGETFIDRYRVSILLLEKFRSTTRNSTQNQLHSRDSL